MGCAHHWRKSQHQYKVSGNATWSNGELFAPQPSLTSGNPVNAIAAGKSVPGRIQLFAAIPDRAAGTAQLVTCWQEKPNEESFFAWESMAGAPTLGSTVPVVAAHNLPDGRLQLWAYSSSNELFTCWKSGNEQSAPYEFFSNDLPLSEDSAKLFGKLASVISARQGPADKPQTRRRPRGRR